MAGIYIFVSPKDSERAGRAARSLSYYDDEEQRIVASDRLTCVWSGVNDVALWGPAQDPRTGNFVITSGRISFEETDWLGAEKLHLYDGGLAARILLHQFNESGIDGVLEQSGPAVIFVWDNVRQQLHLTTDRMGYHPIFLYREHDVKQCAISTSPDAIANDPRSETSFDRVAMAEFLSGWRATPPNTYYKEITYAAVASHHIWDLSTNSHRVREYWHPFEDDFYRNIDEASDALEEALTQSIRVRTTARLSPVVCFASGGLDSRAILFNAADNGEVVALNLFDAPGRDARIAQDLCAATGTRYVGFGRDLDYYPRLMRENARVGNGMWSLEDQHYLGTRGLVRALGARTVMTACTTDWVFKGYGLEKTYRRFLGRNLPFQKLTNERIDAFLPNYRLPVAAEYRKEIDERYRAWTGDLPRRLETDHDRLRAEDKRVRPACYAVSVSGGIMYRAFPYDTFLGDRRMADCYSRMRPGWKLNSSVWGMTVRRMGGPGGRLPDSGSGFAPGDSIQMQLLKFGSGWLKRRIVPSRNFRNQSDSIVAEGSWPNYGWLIRHSGRIACVWNEAPTEDRELLNGVFGRDLWMESLNDWSSRPNEYFRILTMLNWLRLAHSSNDGGRAALHRT